MKEYFEDDRYIVPDDIKRMTPEEIKEEIARLENEIKTKRKPSSNGKIAV